MTNCEICGANCDNDINTIQTCSSCGHGKFHLILSQKERHFLELVFDSLIYNDMFESRRELTNNLMKRLGRLN